MTVPDSVWAEFGRISNEREQLQDLYRRAQRLGDKKEKARISKALQELNDLAQSLAEANGLILR